MNLYRVRSEKLNSPHYAAADDQLEAAKKVAYEYDDIYTVGTQEVRLGKGHIVKTYNIETTGWVYEMEKPEEKNARKEARKEAREAAGKVSSNG